MFVLVQDEVLRQDVRVAEALEDAVDEAGVAVVADPDDAGHLAARVEVEPPLLAPLLALRALLGAVAGVHGDLIDNFDKKVFHRISFHHLLYRPSRGGGAWI